MSLQKILNEIQQIRANFKEIEPYDEIITLIKDNFQQELSDYIESLHDIRYKNETSLIDGQNNLEKLKSATIGSLDYSGEYMINVNMQRELYQKLGREYALGLFVTNLIDCTWYSEDILFIYELLIGSGGKRVRFRQEEVFLINEFEQKIEFVKSEIIPQEINKLLTLLYNPNENEILSLFARFHHKFLQIHPFSDGNGRIARLLLNLLFIKYGYLPIKFGKNEIIDYYIALIDCDNNNYSTLELLLATKQLEALNLFIQSQSFRLIKEKFETKKRLEQIKGQFKCIILTEDSKIENSHENFLKTIFEASGFHIPETKFISYEGCSNINSVTLFSLFVKEKFSDISIIVHRDRDYLTDLEVEKQKRVFHELNVYFFVTDGTDCESHFINPQHIWYCHNEISLEEAKEMIDECIMENRDKSIEMLKKKEFGDKYKDKYTHLNDAIVNIIEEEPFRFSHGKTLLKILKTKIQKQIKNNSMLIRPSLYIKNDMLHEISKKIWGDKE